MSRPLTLRRLARNVGTESGLLLIGIPILLWTMIPIYHMFLFAISPKDAAFSGQLWPAHPTLRNFGIVFNQEHHFLYNFWRQMWNSIAIACATAILTLMIATMAASSNTTRSSTSFCFIAAISRRMVPSSGASLARIAAFMSS